MSHPLLMKSLAPLLLLFFAALPSAGQSEVDFSGVDQFWEIVDLLERNIEPSEEDWSDLFSTPGYRYLVENENKDTLFREYFPLVFMPSRQNELDSVRNAGADRYLSHYMQVAQRRAELHRFQEELSGMRLTESALQKTAAYLPEGLIAEHPDPPPVSFAIFEPDGKANQEIVVVDLHFATLIDLVPFLAHEAHHFYKGQINRLNRPDPDHEDYPLVRSVAQLQTEGVADLIDKRHILETAAKIDSADSWYAQHYKQHVQNAPSTFRRMDDLIQEMVQYPDQKRENGEEIWEMLPFGAHPHGGYMAMLVENHLGKEVLIDTLDNPFAFFRAFNQAAHKAGGEHHVFSEQSMRYLHTLEEKYVR